MCGIVGFTHRDTCADPERIRAATASLRHRGPDQQGVYETDAVSLGAVRLKIIDLAGGDQPMASDDGGVIIVFNGEIYNHRELRRELEDCGERFRSRCDTEVVLRAFLKWDVGCFKRLRGMFAVALWRGSDRRLVLARDRMGIKPLYLHQRGQELYFGSELKAILIHPEIDRRIDTTGLGYYLSLNYTPCPYTLVDGIEKLPPGYWLEWRDGRVTSDAWWRLELRPHPIAEAAAKEELDWLLRESVREHLMSDVPVGVWSSGGVDSSTVLHYAAEASSARLKTFSISFLGQRCDESPYFRSSAEVYGAEHQELDLSTDLDLAGAIQELSYYSDEPGADAGALPVWFLSKMSRAGVTVALSGEGADELFGGYYTYLADRYAARLRRVPAALRRLGVRLLRPWPVSDEKLGLEYKVKRFLAGSLLSPAEAHFYWNGTFSEHEKRALATGDGGLPAGGLAASLPPEARGLDDLGRYLWLDQKYYLPDDILYKCDRMSMAHSLEVRPPFLDHRIVEFAASLPTAMKVRNGTLKHILRETVRDKVPAAILDRRKEGFDIPAHQWLRGALRPLLTDVVNAAAARRTGLFHPDAVERLVQDHLARRANVGYHLWGLLTLFLWIDKWKIETSPAVERLRATGQPLVGAMN